ncbi:MAG: thioredoxin domain-containing protein, partial [Thermoleophilaceae bacterium]
MDPLVATLSPPVDTARDHLRGALDAPVTLVEYGDFQCPDCNGAYSVVEWLLARIGDSLRFV